MQKVVRNKKSCWATCGKLAPAMLWPKKAVISTHLLKIQLCLGWKGMGCYFYLYHWKGPDTLTSIVVILDILHVVIPVISLVIPVFPITPVIPLISVIPVIPVTPFIPLIPSHPSHLTHPSLPGHPSQPSHFCDLSHSSYLSHPSHPNYPSHPSQPIHPSEEPMAQSLHLPYKPLESTLSWFINRMVPSWGFVFRQWKELITTTLCCSSSNARKCGIDRPNKIMSLWNVILID